MNLFYILAKTKSSCNNIFTPDGLNIVREILSYFRIIAPALLIVLISMDLVSIMVSKNTPSEKQYLKYITRIRNRTIATILLLFVPTIVTIILGTDAVKENLVSDPLCLKATGSNPKNEELYESLGIHYEMPSSHNPAESGGSGNGGSGGSGNSNTVVYGNCDPKKRCRKTITINGRTYDMYIQLDFPDVGFTGSNVSQAGCSAVGFLQAASGFNRNLTIYDAVSLVKERSFTGITRALRSVGIPYSDKIIYYNSNDYNKAAEARVCQQVREHLKKGKPAIAILNGAPYAGDNHFVTLFGEDEQGRLITGNCRKEVGSLEEMVALSMRGGRKGFLLVG